MQERLTTKDIAAGLTDIGAVYLAPERKKLASGKLSCLYFNVGDLVISHPKEKDLVIDALAQTYRDLKTSSNRLVGVPEGANCIASSVADRLKIGQLRVRETMTGHGDQRSIEGYFEIGQLVTVVEDVMSTGGSTIKRAIEPIKTAGLKPHAVIALIDREYGGIQAMQKLGIAVRAFTTTTEIAEELIRGGMLNDQQITLLQEELEELKAVKTAG